MAIRGFQRFGSLLPAQCSVRGGLSNSSLRIARLSAASFSSFNKPSPTPFNENEPSHVLSNKWKRRYIEITDMPSESQQKQLTFEEYKQKHLISFEEYEKNIKLYYKDDDTVKIEKSYEAYCKSGYNGYLLELKQFNPGIIL